MTQEITTEKTKGNKEHFIVLDGLRGIAAIGVVVFHFMEWVFPDYHQNFIGHGFLAVDFFFCLSGFVIGYAYDNRIATTGKSSFLKARIIRLHPLVLFGSVLGLIGYFIDPFTVHTDVLAAGQLALLFLTSALLIPYPVMEERGFNLFSLNAPSWSLFWEYIASFAYAFILSRLPRRILLFVALLMGGLLLFVSYRSGNLVGGWSGPTFWDGGVRVGYSFCAGLLVYRYRFIKQNKLGFAGMGLLLLAALVMPSSGMNWLAEAAVVLFNFPVLIGLGAGTSVSGAMKKICVLAGNLSYPLYMTHYFVIWMFGGYYTQYQPRTQTLVPVVFITTLLLLLFAYLVMKYFDIPVRKYLTKRFQ